MVNRLLKSLEKLAPGDNFNRMVNNETRSIWYKNIEKLCELLSGSLRELFELEASLEKATE